MTILYTVLGIILFILFIEFIKWIDEVSTKREEKKQKKEEAEAIKRAHAEDQRKKQEFEDSIKSYRKKWKTHPLYLDVLNACKNECHKLYTAVSEGHTSKFHCNLIEQSHYYCITFSPGEYGVSIGYDSFISFKKLGYKNLELAQYLALTLSLGDSLTEEFKNYADVAVSASYYKSLEDGWRTEVLVGVKKKEDNTLKSVDL